MNELTPEQIAWARNLVQDETTRGTAPADIDAALKEALGTNAKEVMAVKGRDVVRAVGMGATGGFLDEMNGVLAKVQPFLSKSGVAQTLGFPAVIASLVAPKGQSYQEARDDVRGNYAAAKTANPKTMLAADVAGGVLPAIATAGMTEAPQGVSLLARMAHAAKVAGLFGATEGAGRSDAPDVAGVAKDAAISGAGSAALGMGGELAGTMLKKAGSSFLDRLSPSRAVVREAATQIPADAAAAIAKQESVAPGTAVIGALSPELRALTRGVGADAKTGVLSRTAAEVREEAIREGKKAVGRQYDALQQTFPIDDDLRDILSRTGAKKIKGDEIDFKTLQKIRSNLKEDARLTRKASISRAKNDAADELTEWLHPRVPNLQAVDANYARLARAGSAAEEITTELTNSSKNHAASRTFGAEAGSIGGSLPHGSKGFAMLDKLIAPDRAARARSVNELLLTPGNTQDALKRILAARAKMNAKPASFTSAALHSWLAPTMGSRLPGLFDF